MAVYGQDYEDTVRLYFEPLYHISCILTSHPTVQEAEADLNIYLRHHLKCLLPSDTVEVRRYPTPFESRESYSLVDDDQEYRHHISTPNIPPVPLSNAWEWTNPTITEVIIPIYFDIALEHKLWLLVSFFLNPKPNSGLTYDERITLAQRFTNTLPEADKTRIIADLFDMAANWNGLPLILDTILTKSTPSRNAMKSLAVMMTSERPQLENDVLWNTATWATPNDASLPSPQSHLFLYLPISPHKGGHLWTLFLIAFIRNTFIFDNLALLERGFRWYQIDGPTTTPVGGGKSISTSTSSSLSSSPSPNPHENIETNEITPVNILIEALYQSLKNCAFEMPSRPGQNTHPRPLKLTDFAQFLVENSATTILTKVFQTMPDVFYTMVHEGGLLMMMVVGLRKKKWFLDHGGDGDDDDGGWAMTTGETTFLLCPTRPASRSAMMEMIIELFIQRIDQFDDVDFESSTTTPKIAPVTLGYLSTLWERWENWLPDRVHR